MRKWLSPLLSLFTVVGGHLLNRRLDLSLLFFVLLLILTLLSIYVIPMIMMSDDTFSADALGSLYSRMGYTMATTLSLLLLASAIVSVIFSGKYDTQPRISIAGKAAGMLAVLFSIATLLWAGMTSATFIKQASTSPDHVSTSDDGEADRSSIRHTFFHETVRYTGEWVEDDGLTVIPEGDAYLVGKVSFHGKAAAGVSLRAIIDRHYTTRTVTTDKEGLFRFSVPEGEWTINRLEITSWEGLPNGTDITVTAGHEQVLSDGIYSNYVPFSNNGLTLTALLSPEPQDGLILTATETPLLLNPINEKQPVDPAKDRIRWKPVKNAVRYQLQLHHMERSGNSTRYTPTTWLTTQTTTIPLERFPLLKTDSNAKNEYAVKVYAFDEQGRLLSNNEYMRDSSLVISGAKFADRKDVQSLGDTSNLSPEDFAAKLESRLLDNNRIQAARTLVKEGMPDSAETLLQRIETPDMQTDKNVVMSMVHAARGDCDIARQLLSDIAVQRDKECEPDFVTAHCPE